MRVGGAGGHLEHLDLLLEGSASLHLVCQGEVAVLHLMAVRLGSPPRPPVREARRLHGPDEPRRGGAHA
jgi:hypothetical protein